MWNNHEELALQGVLLPGDSNRQHLWASGVVREDPNHDRRGPAAAHAWDRRGRGAAPPGTGLGGEPTRWPGTAVISHEFFAAASLDQAAAAVAAFGDADV